MCSNALFAFFSFFLPFDKRNSLFCCLSSSRSLDPFHTLSHRFYFTARVHRKHNSRLAASFPPPSSIHCLHTIVIVHHTKQQETGRTRNPSLFVTGTAHTHSLSSPASPSLQDAGPYCSLFLQRTLDLMPMDTPAGAAPDTIMTHSTTPTTTPSSLPNPSINGESIQTNGAITTTSNLTVTAAAHLVTETDKVVLANTNTIAQDLTLSDIAHAPILSAADLLPQDPSSLIEPSHGVTITPSIPSVDLTPLTTTVPAGFGVSILPGLDLSVNAANDEFIVMDNGLITGA